MLKPPLLLEQSVFSDLAIEGNPSHKPGGEHNSENKMEVAIALREGVPGGWHVRLDLEVIPGKPNPGPYHVKLRSHGFFRVPEKMPEHEAANLVGITGASILYSSAREYLLMITG